jgi:hypothetical protein
MISVDRVCPEASVHPYLSNQLDDPIRRDESDFLSDVPPHVKHFKDDVECCRRWGCSINVQENIMRLGRRKDVVEVDLKEKCIRKLEIGGRQEKRLRVLYFESLVEIKENGGANAVTLVSMQLGGKGRNTKSDSLAFEDSSLKKLFLKLLLPRLATCPVKCEDALEYSVISLSPANVLDAHLQGKRIYVSVPPTFGASFFFCIIKEDLAC